LAAVLSIGIVAAILQRPAPVGRGEEFDQTLSLLRDGEFAQAAAKAHRNWTSQPRSEWRWRFRLIEAEALLEEGKSAASQAVLNAGSAKTSPEFEIRRRLLLARQLNLPLLQLEALVLEAAGLATKYSRPDLEPEIDLLLGQFLARRGKIAPAEEILYRANHSARATGDLFRVAASFNSLGMVQVSQFRYDRAIPLFEQAKDLYGSVRAHQWVAAADNNMVMCYSRLGDFDKAHTVAEEALRLARPGLLRANALGEIGMTFVYQENFPKAIPYFRKARDMARQFHFTGVAARWAGNLTQVLAATEDWDAAEQALQEATRLGPEARSRVFLELDAADIARGRGLFPQARAIYEQAMASAPDNPGVQWDSYAGIANTWVATGAADLANRNFDAAIRVIEGHQSDLRGSDNKITFLSRLIRFYQDYVNALITQNQPVKALAVADGSRARVLSQRFNRNLPATAPQQEAEFQTIARQSGSVWLSYWLAPNRSFLWVTTPKEIRWFPLEASAAEIARLVEDYRGLVENIRDPLQVENPAGRRLYEILIAPAAPLIPPGTRVIIVPDGPLHQLSFETLPVYGGPRPHYWIEDATVSIAPSFGVFSVGRPAPGATRKSLLIGDALSPGPGFPRLEFSAEEIDTIEKHLSPGVSKRLREAASPEIWKQGDLASFDIIHFAAHAEANRQSPLDSAIILSPANGFRLHARDIIDVKLHADLVTLSACRSSGARTYAGEGLVGLTWAFLQAGSRNVVAGLWDVADESTSQLMDRFYAGIAKGTQPTEALRSAQLDLLHTAHSKPYYWGPFQCYRR
jgi:CHAT domain-containing protein/tetratricopeptide (TPR) repeat protein